MLNTNQKKAVEDIFKATLVVAGPGTGKTELLTERIRKIKELTDTPPSSILCLTYSRAGVKAMKDRLEKKFGKEYSEQVKIHTFHSFCDTVIKSNKDYFRNIGRCIIDDIKIFDLINSLLSDINIAGSLHTVKPANAKLLNNIKKIFNTIKEDQLDINLLKSNVHNQIAQLLNEKQTVTVKKEIEKQRKLVDCLQVIERLIPKIKEEGFYDYNDMINFVIEFFNNNPEELQTYRENLLFVLVDELQDTNPLQLTLLNQLIFKNGDESPSVFAVGDDDQCIFRFQGASVETIIKINNEVPGIENVVLNENYRSTQDILDMAGNLIAHNEIRVINEVQNLTKDLIVGLEENRNVKTIPDIWKCIDKTHEANVIVNSIKNKIEKEGAKPSDFAILYRTRYHGDAIINAIKQSGLPFTSKDDNANILNMGFVSDIDNALQFMRMEYYKKGSGDGHFFNIILNNRSKYNVFDCLELKDVLSQNNQPYRKSFTQNLAENDNAPIHSELFAELKMLAKGLISLKDKINKVITDEDWNDLYTILKIDKNDTVLLKDWEDFLKKENEYKSDYTLIDWAELFMDHRYYNVSIKSSKELSRDGITLSTVHGSKGLEFKHVFIVGCSNNKWEKEDSEKSSIKLPPRNITNDSSNLEDKRRLFYVGLTRAEKGITFTYYPDGQNKSTSDLSTFVKEAIPNFLNHIRTINQPLPAIRNQRQLNELLGIHYATLQNKVQNTVHFSPSSLKTYIDCTSKFLLTNIFNLPTTSSEAPSFGTAMHNVIEKIIENDYHNKAKNLGLDFIRETWPLEMESSKHFFTKNRRIKYEQYGLNILLNYFDHYIHNRILGNNVEQEIKYFGILGNARINGKLDRLEKKDGMILVTDYKTGNADYSKWTVFKDEENFGGDHWRQAMFYATLVMQNNPGIKLNLVNFHYLENDIEDILKAVNVEPSDQNWINFINLKWQQLQNLEFNTPCLNNDCLCCRNIS